MIKKNPSMFQYDTPPPFAKLQCCVLHSYASIVLVRRVILSQMGCIQLKTALYGGKGCFCCLFYLKFFGSILIESSNKTVNFQLIIVFFIKDFSKWISKKGYGCNGHEGLSSITLTHIIKQRNFALIAVLHFTVTVEFSTIRLIHILK